MSLYDTPHPSRSIPTIPLSQLTTFSTFQNRNPTKTPQSRPSQLPTSSSFSPSSPSSSSSRLPTVSPVKLTCCHNDSPARSKSGALSSNPKFSIVNQNNEENMTIISPRRSREPTPRMFSDQRRGKERQVEGDEEKLREARRDPLDEIYLDLNVTDYGGDIRNRHHSSGPESCEREPDSSGSFNMDDQSRPGIAPLAEKARIETPGIWSATESEESSEDEGDDINKRMSIVPGSGDSRRGKPSSTNGKHAIIPESPRIIRTDISQRKRSRIVLSSSPSQSSSSRRITSQSTIIKNGQSSSSKLSRNLISSPHALRRQTVSETPSSNPLATPQDHLDELNNYPHDDDDIQIIHRGSTPIEWTPSPLKVPAKRVFPGGPSSSTSTKRLAPPSTTRRSSPRKAASQGELKRRQLIAATALVLSSDSEMEYNSAAEERKQELASLGKSDSRSRGRRRIKSYDIQMDEDSEEEYDPEKESDATGDDDGDGAGVEVLNDEDEIEVEVEDEDNYDEPGAEEGEETTIRITDENEDDDEDDEEEEEDEDEDAIIEGEEELLFPEDLTQKNDEDIDYDGEFDDFDADLANLDMNLLNASAVGTNSLPTSNSTRPSPSPSPSPSPDQSISKSINLADGSIEAREYPPSNTTKLQNIIEPLPFRNRPNPTSSKSTPTSAFLSKLDADQLSTSDDSKSNVRSNEDTSYPKLMLITDLPKELQEFYTQHWRRGADRAETARESDGYGGGRGTLNDETARNGGGNGNGKSTSIRGRGGWRGRGRRGGKTVRGRKKCQT